MFTELSMNISVAYPQMGPSSATLWIYSWLLRAILTPSKKEKKKQYLHIRLCGLMLLCFESTHSDCIYPQPCFRFPKQCCISS